MLFSFRFLSFATFFICLHTSNVSQNVCDPGNPVSSVIVNFNYAKSAAIYNMDFFLTARVSVMGKWKVPLSLHYKLTWNGRSATVRLDITDVENVFHEYLIALCDPNRATPQKSLENAEFAKFAIPMSSFGQKLKITETIGVWNDNEGTAAFCGVDYARIRKPEPIVTAFVVQECRMTIDANGAGLDSTEVIIGRDTILANDYRRNTDAKSAYKCGKAVDDGLTPCHFYVIEKALVKARYDELGCRLKTGQIYEWWNCGFNGMLTHQDIVNYERQPPQDMPLHYRYIPRVTVWATATKYRTPNSKISYDLLPCLYGSKDKRFAYDDDGELVTWQWYDKTQQQYRPFPMGSWDTLEMEFNALKVPDNKQVSSLSHMIYTGYRCILLRDQLPVNEVYYSNSEAERPVCSFNGREGSTTLRFDIAQPSRPIEAVIVCHFKEFAISYRNLKSGWAEPLVYAEYSNKTKFVKEPLITVRKLGNDLIPLILALSVTMDSTPAILRKSTNNVGKVNNGSITVEEEGKELEIGANITLALRLEYDKQLHLMRVFRFPVKFIVTRMAFTTDGNDDDDGDDNDYDDNQVYLVSSVFVEE